MEIKIKIKRKITTVRLSFSRQRFRSDKIGVLSLSGLFSISISRRVFEGVPLPAGGFSPYERRSHCLRPTPGLPPQIRVRQVCRAVPRQLSSPKTRSTLTWSRFCADPGRIFVIRPSDFLWYSAFGFRASPSCDDARKNSKARPAPPSRRRARARCGAIHPPLTFRPGQS
jgi:hypothetical protein